MENTETLCSEHPEERTSKKDVTNEK